MGLFDIFSKKKSNTFNQQVQNTEVNRFGEDLTRLNENGELPWGWVSRKDDFRDKIASEYSYFFNECTSQQKVDTTLYFYTSFNEHNTPYTVLESDNSESMPDVLH